jgi:endonuclease/exonuclease/phosphatase family metal-dependent hydrolase
VDKFVKRGRKAHGHNGRVCSNRTSDRSKVNTFDDILQSKPKGSCQIEGSKETGKLTTINLCTYNVRTLKAEEKLENLLEDREDFKWDVVGLAETKREEEGLIELKGGSWLFNHGKTEDNKDARGVGFLIHTKFKDFVKEVKSYSNRVISMNVQLTSNKQMCVIQVYAPTTDYEDSEVEEFYEDIDRAIKENKGKYTIVMGDFNAKVGKCRKGEELILGNFGVGERNKRGDTLLEFAAEQKFVIANTIFKKDQKRYWTWESPNGSTRNQIDFILCSQRGIVKNCEIITKVDIVSDQRMVRATLCINTKLVRLKFINSRKKERINMLKLKERTEEFQLKLKNRFEILEVEDMDIDTKCNQITTVFLEEAANLAPSERVSKIKSDEDKSIENLDKRRKQLREITTKTKAQKIEYAEIVKTVRKKRRQRTRKRNHTRILGILESGRGPKTVMKQSRKKTRISKLKHKDGNVTSSRSENTGNLCRILPGTII